jgi:hypothetical protein
MEQPIKEIVEALESEALQAGMTAKSLDVYKAAQLGASEATKQHIRILHDQIEVARQTQVSLESVRSISEAISNSMLNLTDNSNLTAAQKEVERLISQANKLQGGYRSAALERIGPLKEIADIDAYFEKEKKRQDKMKKTREALFDLWKGAATPAEQYYMRLSDIWKKLNDLKGVSQQVKDALWGRYLRQAQTDWASGFSKSMQTGSFREVDTRNMSISGLAMNGENTIPDLIRLSNKYLQKIASQRSLN